MNALLPVKVNAHWCQEQTITTRNTTTKSQHSVLPRSCGSTGHLAFLLWLFAAPAFAFNAIQVRTQEGMVRFDEGACQIPEVVHATNLIDRKYLRGGMVFQGNREKPFCWHLSDDRQTLIIIDERSQKNEIPLESFHSDKPGN